MCGIIGIVGKIPDKNTCEKARDVLEHRGPDSAGIFYEPKNNIYLGHRRLSIIDLSSAGQQPFFSNDKRYSITFNGEIYNYKEVKKELDGLYEFKTKSDTEVLLASYIIWGEDFLQKLNGMFAFAIWDSQEKSLFIARDRIGIKPFFYHHAEDGTFSFASEIKAILKLGIKAKQNEGIIFDYLYHGFYDHTPETFFQNIYQIPAAHFAIWKDGKLTIKKYWDVSNAENIIEENEEKIKEKFLELLADAIKLRFRSDVPVGLNLSSGLDSNTLLYYSKKITGENVHTFSVCLPSEEYNECLLIENFLSENQFSKWHTSGFDRDTLFQAALAMNQVQDQPYGGIPTITHAAAYQSAKENNITVVLEGQGLDEILAGYKYYQLEHEKDLLEERTSKKLNEDEEKLSSLEYSQDMTKLIHQNIFDQEFIERHKNRVLKFNKPFKSYLKNAQYRDLLYVKLPRVLRFNDHTSMKYSRELRVPYLDHRLVEFCFSLPAKFKLNDSSQKVLARESMENILPDIVNAKQKKSAGAVQTEWLRNNFKKEVFNILESESFKSRGYWNHEELIKQANDFYSGKGNNSFYLWQCINLEMWLRNYID